MGPWFGGMGEPPQFGICMRFTFQSICLSSACHLTFMIMPLFAPGEKAE